MRFVLRYFVRFRVVANSVPEGRRFLVEEMKLRFRRYGDQQPSRKEEAYPVHVRTIGSRAAAV